MEDVLKNTRGRGQKDKVKKGVVFTSWFIREKMGKKSTKGDILSLAYV
jgi:hypothetical protein